MKSIYTYIGIVLLLFSCKKEIGPQNINEDEKGIGNLIILNEGNFGQGNASVSIYNPKTKEVFNNQFKAVNGFGIGDVLQSVKRYQDRLYFVVNNSGKIVITDTNLVYQSEITGFNSPRYMEIMNGKGFVTDLKQKAVYVVDLNTNQITNQIPTQGWTEQLLQHQNKLYVLDRGDYLTNSGPNYIFILNPITEQKEDSIMVNLNPNSMVIDKNNNLWVLSSGKLGIEVPKLSSYDLVSNSFIDSLSFNGTSSPSKLKIKNSKEELYFINSSIYKMNINDSLIPVLPFFQKTTENFYGISTKKGVDEIFLFDAKNYNQQGDIILLNSNAIIIDKNSVGIIPSFLY